MHFSLASHQTLSDTSWVTRRPPMTIHAQFLPTLTDSLEQGLRNGMSFKQLKARIPAFVARKLGFTEQQFHAQLTEAEQVGGDLIMQLVAELVASKFTAAERAEIATRK